MAIKNVQGMYPTNKRRITANRCHGVRKKLIWIWLAARINNAYGDASTMCFAGSVSSHPINNQEAKGTTNIGAIPKDPNLINVEIDQNVDSAINVNPKHDFLTGIGRLSIN